MAVLRKIRIGTDITLGITVMASGHAVDWDSQDIKHVYAFSDIQGQPVAEMSYEQRGSTLRCVFHAEDQNYVGAYRVIIEFNDGSAFSSTLDMPAFEIVRTSEEADIDTGEIVLDIDGSMRFYSLAEVISKLEGLHTEVKAAASAAREASDNANNAAKKANDAAALANSNASKAEASNKVINDNERKRIAQETARESAEADRKRAELERQKGDESIANKEAERERNEEVRETNEQTRESNELERRNAESARDRAEAQRATSETSRISNETSRQAAENKRVAAETSRKEAETARVNAEAGRVTEFARLKKESEAATKAASEVSDVVAQHTTKITKIEQLLQEGYTFMGVATPETNPSTLDQKVYYIAQKNGIYANFDGIQVYANENALLVYDTYWTKVSLDILKDIANANHGASLELFNEVASFFKMTEEPVTIKTIANKFIDSKGEIEDYPQGGFSILEANVQGGEIYKISASTAPIENSLFAFYKGDDVVSWSNLNKTEISNYVIAIPKGVNKLYVTNKEIGAITKITSFDSIVPLDNLTLQTQYIKSIVDSITEPIVNDVKLNIVLHKYIEPDGTIADISTGEFLVGDALIQPKTEYKIKGIGYVGNCLYLIQDVNGNVLLKQQLVSSYNYEEAIILTPPNSYKIFIEGLESASPSLLETSEYISKPKWKNKKWVVVGDSLTEVNLRATKNYADYISEKTGISVVNMGRSGTGYKRTYDEGFAFYQRIVNVPLDADVITIFGSFNDNPFFNNLGTATDTGTDTIGGCINTCLDNLFEKNPLANVGIVSPTPWSDAYPSVSGPDNYVKLLKDICERRGIPFYDLYHNSGLRPWDAKYRSLAYKRDGTYAESTAETPNAIQVTAELLDYVKENGVPNASVGDWVLMSGGGTHPDEDGHKLIAPRFEDFLNSLLLS